MGRGGIIVSIRLPAKWAGTGILVALGVATAHPATAQIAFGSPADPPRIAIGGGAFGTGKGAFYGYGGFSFDINFFERFVVTPNAAVGYFTHGTGIDLGAHTEFREGAEFAYHFDNLSRLGVGMYHISNAGIGQHNPGAEFVTLVLTMPFR